MNGIIARQGYMKTTVRQKCIEIGIGHCTKSWQKINFTPIGAVMSEALGQKRRPEISIRHSKQCDGSK
jgi:hypothetical protein